MSSYAIGSKTVKRLCQDQSALAWHHAKLSPVLFTLAEQPVFEYVQSHLSQHHVLPQVETLVQHFPDLEPLATPEPASYYLQHLEQQFIHGQVTDANLHAQSLLKADPTAGEAATTVLHEAVRRVALQKYRTRILDMGKEGPSLVLHAYHHVHTLEAMAEFGWPYLDAQSGGVLPGDVISFVGRPAVGKTWLTLWTTLHNWMVRKLNVLYVSMEMTLLPIAQRIAALYAHQNIAQLKVGGYSDVTLKKFFTGLKAMVKEQAKLYIVDGNLAATVEDLFALAETLQCRMVVIDGAYLLRHRNPRLDRYTRAAENVELIKRSVTDAEMLAFCSWQFNREAAKKQKKAGGDKGDLEDVGYSDAIGQISSIVLSLYQEDTVETLKERKVQVLKGRNGEVGQFSIAWQFDTMTFHQTQPALVADKADPADVPMQWV